jgi:hypothetical protein
MLKEFELKDFTRIDVGGVFEVEIVRAEAFAVSLEADDFTHIRVVKLDAALFISRQGIEWFAPFHSRPRARVTLPVLNGLNVSGASQGELNNLQSAGNLTVTLSGASHLRARNICVNSFDARVTGASSLLGDCNALKEVLLEASGASKIELIGAAARAVVKVNGASKTDLSKFPVQSADLEISGASHALINLNGKLSANVSGASSLLWSGAPIMGDIQVSGASHLRKQ